MYEVLSVEEFRHVVIEKRLQLGYPVTGDRIIEVEKASKRWRVNKGGSFPSAATAIQTQANSANAIDFENQR